MPAITVSLPRRAMEQMGFAVCCLMCDEVDIAGSSRCKACIESHTKSRERLNKGTPKTKADRLAREFINMLTNPHKYIDNSNHGESMIYYSSLINQHNGIVPPESFEDVRKRYEILRKNKPKSLISDVANQNKWLENPPNYTEREELLKLITGKIKSKHPLGINNLLEEIDKLLEDNK